MDKLGMKKNNFSRNSFSKRKKRKLVFVYVMLFYTLVHFAIFYLFVNLNSFKLAFVDKTTGAWNNFANFKFFINDFIENGKDSIISSNIGNTMLYFLVNTFCQLPLAMFFAYFLYKKILGHRIFMVIFMIPMLISTVVLADIYIQAVGREGVIGQMIAKIFNTDISIVLCFNYTSHFN